MLIYILRHGRTTYSATYRVNGDPRVPVTLDDRGVAQCHAARATLPLAGIASCVCSPFPRTQQTAELLTRGYQIPIRVNDHLAELDYGQFEGRPFTEYAGWLAGHGGWARPPGAAEAQREGIRRMMSGLRAELQHAGPLLVVTHGLPVSVLRHGRPLDDLLFLPEAPYVAPVTFTPDELRRLLDELDSELERVPGRSGYSM